MRRHGGRIGPRRILAAVEELLGCTACPRLASHLADVRSQHPDYHALPVPQFGDERAPLLIVGLAPGMHGANRTGRPFRATSPGSCCMRRCSSLDSPVNRGRRRVTTPRAVRLSHNQRRQVPAAEEQAQGNRGKHVQPLPEARARRTILPTSCPGAGSTCTRGRADGPWPSEESAALLTRRAPRGRRPYPVRQLPLQ
jgi:hypothetical protein